MEKPIRKKEICDSNNHSSERTKTGVCFDCQRAYDRWHYLQNKEKKKKQAKDYLENNREKCNKYKREYRAKNPDKWRKYFLDQYYQNWEREKETNRRYRRNNSQKVREYSSKWKKENKGKVASYSSKRRARLLQAIPKWANLLEIQKFYESCPEGMTVDHIVPLVNKNVCGLHTIDNLQYLTPIDNSIKSNKFDLDLQGVN